MGSFVDTLLHKNSRRRVSGGHVPKGRNITSRSYSRLVWAHAWATHMHTLTYFSSCESRRETALPPLRRGGVVAAVLALLQPRSGHEKRFAEVSVRLGYDFDLSREVRRLRETFPSSMNNLVVFLGLLGMLDGILPVLQV